MRERSSTRSASSEKIARIALVGNPNVGKSVVFGWLTGHYVTVSNYPGTTVEIAQGNARVGGRKWVIVDTPGINNLIPMSEEEQVTRDILLEEEELQVIQVCDAKNLRRGLVITLQLAEMGKAVILVLNMADEAKERGIFIDYRGLSALLEIPVFYTVATRKKGLEELGRALEEESVPRLHLHYGEEIEEAIDEIAQLLPDTQRGKRGLALMLMSGDETLRGWLHAQISELAIQKIGKICERLQQDHAPSLGFFINEKRMKAADSLLEGLYRREYPGDNRWMAVASRYTTHPVWGIPILLGVLYLLYKFVADLGAGRGVDFMQNIIFGRGINPAAIWMVQNLAPPGFWQELLVGPYGLVTMGLTYALAIVLPIVGTFFFAFGLLEDSGYLPRLAIMADRFFKTMGLNGKAALPMVLGLGCDTMATLTTRILETPKERILVTLLLALGVPCSAQVGVMMGMFAGLSIKAVILWGLVVLGSMVIVGFLASKLIPGEKADFILEIPPLRIPTWSNILIKTIARVEWFLKEAVPLFLLGTLCLFIFDRLGLLIALQRLAEPVVVRFLNLPVKTTEAFLLGFLRRDYGAAGLFMMAKAGELDPNQIVVSLVTLTLFVPCLANFFMIIKERGLGQALLMAGFIFPFAFFIGGMLNYLLRLWQIQL